MELHYEKLSLDNKHLLSKFTCKSDTTGLNSKDRRRVEKHDKDIENFLKNEAFDEQAKLFNTTHLLINEQNELVGFVSLCNDSLKLSNDSKNKFQTVYCSVPAVKIARLGINSKYQGNGLGQKLLTYSLFKAVNISELSGAAFITLDCYKHRESFYIKNGFTRSNERHDSEGHETPISMYKHILSWVQEYS